MSDRFSMKKSNVSEKYESPPAYDLNCFLDSDSDCEAPSPSKSRKNNKARDVDHDPPADRAFHNSDTDSIYADPRASNLTLDTDSDESGYVDSDTPEKQRAYTPPSYLAKGRSTFSRYTDLKYGMPSPAGGEGTDPVYSDPPSYNLNNFMDSDSECGPEKPDKQNMQALNKRVPAKRYSDTQPDIVSSLTRGVELSSDSSEPDDLEILKKANDISEKCRVQGNSNGSVVISKKPVSLFRRVDSFDSIPPARHRKSIKKKESDQDEDDEDEDSEEGGDVLSSLGLSSKNLVSSKNLIINVDKGTLSCCVCYSISTTYVIMITTEVSLSYSVCIMAMIVVDCC
jgi:hypothetical protein